MNRTLAIGDIHGCYDALQTLLDYVSPTGDDIIITLGDYIDRGPQSKQVIDWMIRAVENGNHLRGSHRRRSHPRVIPLIGNHERMMQHAREETGALIFWLENGGFATLDSYDPGGQAEDLEIVPELHWYFIDHTCRLYYESETHLFVHANAIPHLPLSEQSELELLWRRIDEFPAHPHLSGKALIVGHASQRTGLPYDLGHSICLDTWACGQGWLTCLDVNSGELWQAKQHSRRTRKLHREEVTSA